MSETGPFWQMFRERYPGIAQIPAVDDLLTQVGAHWRSAFERVTALRLALRDLVDHEDEPCRFDHHGYCQEHTLTKPCAVAVARALLDAGPDAGTGLDLNYLATAILEDLTTLGIVAGLGHGADAKHPDDDYRLAHAATVGALQKSLPYALPGSVD